MHDPPGVDGTVDDKAPVVCAVAVESNTAPLRGTIKISKRNDRLNSYIFLFSFSSMPFLKSQLDDLSQNQKQAALPCTVST